MPCTFNPSLSPPWGAEIAPPGHLISPGSSVWANSFCNDLEITRPKCRHPTKSIPVEQMWGGTFCPPPKGGTNSVFWSFLGRGRSVWADSFCNESDFSWHKFRHPTKGIQVEKMWGALSTPPPLRGDALCFLEFSQAGWGVAVGLIPLQ